MRSNALLGRLIVDGINKSLFIAIGVSSILFISGGSIGFIFHDSSLSHSYILLVPDETFQKDFWNVLIRKILARNLGACLLLFSGIATFGFSSIIVISVIGIFVGATAKIGVQAIGAGNLIADILLYVPFEFLGMLVAAAAGLLPIIGKIHQALSIKTKPNSYTESIVISLKLLILAAFFILVAAIIEATLIVLK